MCFNSEKQHTEEYIIIIAVIYFSSSFTCARQAFCTNIKSKFGRVIHTLTNILYRRPIRAHFAIPLLQIPVPRDTYLPLDIQTARVQCIYIFLNHSVLLHVLHASIDRGSEGTSIRPWWLSGRLIGIFNPGTDSYLSAIRFGSTSKYLGPRSADSRLGGIHASWCCPQDSACGCVRHLWPPPPGLPMAPLGCTEVEGSSSSVACQL